jgi:endonuclease III
MKKDSSLAAREKRALEIIKILSKAMHDLPKPMSDLISKKYDNDPFLILISCLLSLRARDVVTYPISVELFKKARTPQQFLKMPRSELEKIIHSIGFYKNKARSIHSVCHELIERFNGKVPHTKEELLSIKGVGPKTANLVLGVAFGIPAICVDTHVHKLSNLLGIVHTKTPLQTEEALQEIIPRRYWIDYNRLFVMCGQNMRVCKPYIEKYIEKK